MCLPVIYDGHTLAVKGDDLAVYDKNPHSALTITVLQKKTATGYPQGQPVAVFSGGS